MKHFIHTLHVSIAVIFLFATIPAYAVLITTDFAGEIYTADVGNVFGVVAGDTVSGSATYDDSLVAAVGGSSVDISSDVDFGLYLTIGSYTFDHTMDVEYLFNQPTLEFFNGQIVSFDFVTLPGINGSLYGLELFLGTEFTARDTDQLIVTGEITRIGDIQIPEPSAIFLFGFGLLGLLGLKRYQNAEG